MTTLPDWDPCLSPVTRPALRGPDRVRVVQVMASMPAEGLTRSTRDARGTEPAAAVGALVPFRLRAASGGRRTAS